MPRPPKPRLVEFMPEVTYFKPAGLPLHAIDEVVLGFDELEALRLKDVEGLEQEECARRMNLSQSTLQRTLSSAREKVARALVEGRAIRIEGGNFKVMPRVFLCDECDCKWEPDSESQQEAPHCPTCGSREVTPRWHRGHGRGHRGMHR